MNEHLFLLLNPLILLFITSLRTPHDNLHKTKLYFPKSTISLEAYLFQFKWNGSALPIISLSFLMTTTRHIVHPCCGVQRWRASVLICNEKPQQKTFLLLQKVIYLGTSLRCHIYPSKRQQSKQVIWDMSKTCTGKKKKRKKDCCFNLKEIQVIQLHWACEAKSNWKFQQLFVVVVKIKVILRQFFCSDGAWKMKKAIFHSLTRLVLE